MSEIPENKRIVEDLIMDIEDEQCVILIGPEILSIDGKSQTHFVHEQVHEQEANHIAFYYANDSLFLFKDDSDKNRVARRIKRLYKSMDFPFQVYKKILELPVPLIISLNPDTFLSEVAEKCGLAHQFNHFRLYDNLLKRAEDLEALYPDAACELYLQADSLIHKHLDTEAFEGQENIIHSKLQNCDNQ